MTWLPWVRRRRAREAVRRAVEAVQAEQEAARARVLNLAHDPGWNEPTAMSLTLTPGQRWRGNGGRFGS